MWENFILWEIKLNFEISVIFIELNCDFSGELLQRVQLRHSEMEKCENISIASVNSICTEAEFSTDDCNVSWRAIFK